MILHRHLPRRPRSHRMRLPAAAALTATALTAAALTGCNATSSDDDRTPPATSAPAPVPSSDVQWRKYKPALKAAIEQAAAQGDCTTFAQLDLYASDVHDPALARYITARATAAGCDLS
jgi:hypothetical protein